MELVGLWLLIISSVASREVMLKLMNCLFSRQVMATTDAFIVAAVATLLIVTSFRASFRPHMPSICTVMVEEDLVNIRVMVAAILTWQGSLTTRTTVCALLAALQGSSASMVYISAALFFHGSSYGNGVMLVIQQSSLLFSAVHLSICPVEQTGASALFICLNVMSIATILTPFLIARVYNATYRPHSPAYRDVKS